MPAGLWWFVSAALGNYQMRGKQWLVEQEIKGGREISTEAGKGRKPWLEPGPKTREIVYKLCSLENNGHLYIPTSFLMVISPSGQSIPFVLGKPLGQPHSCSPNTSLQPIESLAGGVQMQRRPRPLQGLLSSPNRDLGPVFHRRGVCGDSGSAVCKWSCFLQYPAARAREARRGNGTKAPLGPTACCESGTGSLVQRAMVQGRHSQQ